jgi:hypothetical protein
VCAICRDAFLDNDDQGDHAKVNRGLNTLIKFGQKYADGELTTYLKCNPYAVYVHTNCRKTYTNKRRYEQMSEQVAGDSIEYSLQSKSLQSTSTEFHWQQNCFVCRQSAIYDQRHPDRSDVIRVESMELRDRLLTVCNNGGDEWGFTVSHRLHSCIDLVAAEARYHRNCNKNFTYSTVQPQKGRPVGSAKLDAFNETCEWLESTDSDLLNGKIKIFYWHAYHLLGKVGAVQVNRMLWCKTFLC